MAVLKKKDVILQFEFSGEAGPWVTLINGYTRPGSDFRMLARKLVSAGFRVLMFDNRGSGQTETWQSFSLHDMARDVQDLWLELSIKQSHVLGISMGGIVAQLLATQPQTLSITLVSTTMVREFLPSNRAWPDTLPGIEEKLAAYFDAGFFQRNQLLVKAMAKNIFQQLTNNGLAAKSAAQSQALREYGWDAEYPKELPTLILHGESDQIIPYAAAKHSKNQHPSAAVVGFKNCGHLLLAENLSGIVKHATDFWQGVCGL